MVLALGLLKATVLKGDEPPPAAVAANSRACREAEALIVQYFCLAPLHVLLFLPQPNKDTFFHLSVNLPWAIAFMFCSMLAAIFMSLEFQAR